MLFISFFFLFLRLAVARVFDVTAFGAVGDGKHNDTSAIQAALSAAAGEPGCTVFFPSCKSAYLSWPLVWTGPINATMVFAARAQLRAPTMDLWPRARRSWPYNGAYFTVLGGYNVSLLGAGQFATAIDGQGEQWWASFAVNASTPRPNPMVRFIGITALHVQHLQFASAPMFHVTVEQSSDVLFEDVAVNSPPWTINTDGIDPINSSHVVLRRMHITNGDDSVAVKDGCRDVVVEDSIMVGGKGLSIGSLGRYGAVVSVQDILFRNCSLINTTRGISLKSWPGGRGSAHNLTWEDITFDRVSSAVEVTSWYCVNDPPACKPHPNGVNMSLITLRGLHGTHNHSVAMLFNCSALMPCTAIALADIDLVPATGWPRTQNKMECAHATGSAVDVIAPVSCLPPQVLADNVEENYKSQFA